METTRRYFVILVSVLVMALMSGVAAYAQGGRPNIDQTKEFAIPDGVKLIRDVQYEKGNDIWKVDIAVPIAESKTPRPAVIWIHGGGWSGGDKAGGRGLVCRYAQNGYVGISARYRLLGEADFPACIEDVKSIVRFLRANAKQYNIDPNRIGASGHSAGAHLAACLGVIPKEAGLDKGEYLDQSSVVNAVCSIATPTDFLIGREGGTKSEFSRFKGATEEERVALAKKCSPITFANAGAPPYMLIHGTIDGTVPIVNATSFVKALRDAGAKDVNLVMLDNLGHDPIPSHEAFLWPMILGFFDSTIGPHAGKLSEQVALTEDWRKARGTEEGFSWDKVAKYDKNNDGMITRAEWGGTNEMFDRIDRGEDGILQKADIAKERRTAASQKKGATPAQKGKAKQQ